MHKRISIVIFLLCITSLFNYTCLAQDNNSKAQELFSLGIQDAGKGNFSSAKDYFEKSLIICKENDNKRGIALDLGNLGIIQYYLGNTKQALGYYTEALKIANEIGFKEIIALSLENIGVVHRDSGDYDKALEYSNRALELYTETDYKEGVASTTAIIATIYESRGDSDKALEYLNRSLNIYKQINNQRGISSSLGDTGTAYLHLGDYTKALGYYNESLRIDKGIDNRIGIGIALNLIGATYYLLNDYGRALEYCLESLKVCRTTGDKQGITRAIGNMGNIYTKMREYVKALECYKEALDLANNKATAGLYIGNSAILYFIVKDDSKALEYCKKAIALYREIEEPVSLSRNLGNIAFIYYTTGDYTKALEQAKESFSIANTLNIQDQAWRTHSILGIIYEKVNDDKTALFHYKAATDMIESMRGRLKLEKYRLSFLEDKMTVYEKTILLLLKLNKSNEAFDYVERAKSRALLDLLANRVKSKKATELSQEEVELNAKINVLLGQIEKQSSSPNKEQSRAATAQTSQELEKLRSQHQEVINNIKQKDPEFASLISVEPLKSAAVQKLLDKDTTLLEYFVTKEKLLIWIITQKTLEVVEVQITEKELVTKIEALRKSIEARTNDYKEISSQLYKTLIAPAKPNIKTSRLYIVPHKALHYLPYACLMDKDKFLIEDYAITCLPNASVLEFCLKKNKEMPNSLLAFGNPDNSLSYAEDEVNHIKKDFSKAEVFIKENATETKVKTLANNYGILHFACHGELNPISPLYSSLRLAKDSKEDGRLEVWEIYDLNLQNTSLVTLSACQTALGNITNGDDIIGLTRGFIYAGSPSILASLWDVDDQSTSWLMEEFYQNLKNNHTKADSLRLAQLALIKAKTKPASKSRGLVTTKSSPADPSHPYYWAAFELVGEGGMTNSSPILAEENGKSSFDKYDDINEYLIQHKLNFDLTIDDIFLDTDVVPLLVRAEVADHKIREEDAHYLLESLSNNVAGKKAISDLNRIIVDVPQSSAAYFCRARCYRFRGDNNRAIADLNQVIKNDPKNFFAYRGLADIYKVTGEYSLAIANYAQAMALAPMKSRPYFGRAGVLLRHEDYQEAISDYMQAITLNPQNPLSYLYRGYAYKRIGEYEKALADYKKVIDIDSDAFYYVLGTQVPLYRKLGHLEEAEKARQQSEQKVE